MERRDRIMEILDDAKKLAQEYRTLTGKPLGVTGEIAEYEAARILGLELTPARQAGYDAPNRETASSANSRQRALHPPRREAGTARRRDGHHQGV